MDLEALNSTFHMDVSNIGEIDQNVYICAVHTYIYYILCNMQHISTSIHSHKTYCYHCVTYKLSQNSVMDACPTSAANKVNSSIN